MKQMKDSGIEWIGETPEDWELIKIGSIFRCRNEKVNDTDYPPLSVTRNGIVPQMENVAKTDANDNRKMVKVNDFVINSRSDRKQSCGVSDLDGSVSLINTVLYTENTDVILPEYTNLLMKNYGFAEEFYRWGHGIVADLWTTRWQEMKSIVLPLPNTQQQEEIVRFVQKKVCGIDNLIAHEQATIEELKAYKQSVITEAVTKGLDKSVSMKDSGVEWIGKIPKSWKVRRVKTLGGARNGLTYSPEDICDESGTLVLRSSNIKNGKIVLENNVYVSCQISHDLKVRAGDILICARNGSKELIGKNAVIKDENATFGAFMMIYRCEFPQWIYYILNSKIFSYYLGTFFSSTINQLTSTNFNNMLIVFCPNEKERKNIVDYLDKKCADIDSLISIKQQKIEELKEYKKSLIYEYVTGKKEVI